jgi:peptidoglycan/LPS O-acetylase OafA/YrhL
MKWQILAGLRFFLAWIVLCVHERGDFVDSDNVLLYFHKFGGISAVVGFLLISGYSIANSIAKKPEKFYQRRLLRIYPLYFCAVIISLLPFVFLGSSFKTEPYVVVEPSWFVLGGNLLFLQGFILNPILTNISVWTLSIEVFCYILAPLFIKLDKKIIFSLILISSLVYGSYPYLYHYFHVPGYAFVSYGLPFLTFLWAWLLGFSYYFNQDNLYFKIGMVGLGVLLLKLNPLVNGGILALGTYLLVCGVLIGVKNIKLPRAVLNVFNYLGDISYPLYLFHMPALIFSKYVLKIDNAFELMFIALLTSVFFYHTVDVPLRFKKATADSNSKVAS